ncbi:MAG: alpha/beta hydrolase [Burkholderiaceae bacterium]|nr:alpha/beta hydrolase [Burkholderiaceae bacterium]
MFHRNTTINGLNVFYREAGNPSSPTIVLLHGFPSSSHMFRDLIPQLVDKFHVIAPDFIGFGHSAAPLATEFAYTFDALAAHVQALLDQLKITKAIFYMQDYGGPVGLRLASTRPQQVAGLVVQNANAYMDGISEAAANIFMPLWNNNDETGARQMLLAETTKYQYTAGAANPDNLNPDAWTMDQAALDRPGDADRQMALFKNYQSNVGLYDTWHAYFREHQPKTLIAWGKGDPFFTVPGAEAYKRDLKDIEVHYLNGGHFALEEFSSDVAQLIKARF